MYLVLVDGVHDLLPHRHHGELLVAGVARPGARAREVVLRLEVLGFPGLRATLGAVPDARSRDGVGLEACERGTDRLTALIN